MPTEPKGPPERHPPHPEFMRKYVCSVTNQASILEVRTLECLSSSVLNYLQITAFVKQQRENWMEKCCQLEYKDGCS